MIEYTPTLEEKVLRQPFSFELYDDGRRGWVKNPRLAKNGLFEYSARPFDFLLSGQFLLNEVLPYKDSKGQRVSTGDILTFKGMAENSFYRDEFSGFVGYFPEQCAYRIQSRGLYFNPHKVFTDKESQVVRVGNIMNNPDYLSWLPDYYPNLKIGGEKIDKYEI